MFHLSLRRRYLLALLGIAVLIMAHYLGAVRPVERWWEQTVSSTAAPLYGVLVRIREFPLFYEKKALINRVQELELESASVYELKVTARALEEENRALHEAIRFRETSAHSELISRIVGRALNLPNTHLIINRGRLDGVKEGLPVTAGAQILIGKIVESEEKISTVRLLTDSQSGVSVKISGSEEASGLVVGDLGFSLRLTFIPIDYTITKGDIVVTSGLDVNIPGNLVLGTVASEPVPTDDFFKEATVTAVVPATKLTVVSVILPE